MKTCEKCEKLYDEKFEQCPYCTKQTLFNNFDKFEIVISILLISSIVILFINWKLSVILFIIFAALSLFFQIKYPQEANKRFNLVKSEDKENNLSNLSEIEFFDVKHISGIEDVKTRQKCEISISSNKVIDIHDNEDNFLSSFAFSDLKIVYYMKK